MSLPRLSLYLALLAIAFSACSDLEQVEVRNDAGVIVERYQISKVDSAKQGKYELFDQKGVLLETAEYLDDKLEGTRTLYYPTGEKQFVEVHRAGQYQGAYKAYFPDGQLQQEGQYVDNVATGTWTGYYPTGEKKEEVTMSDNQVKGPFKEWHRNGVLKAEGSYFSDGKEQGELKLYDEMGKLERRMFCEEGICRTIESAETPQPALDAAN